jgi:hypothetical protein
MSRFAILPIIGLILIIFGTLWWQINIRHLEKSTIAQGTVVENVRRGRGFAPKIAFTTSNGEEKNVTLWSAQNPPAYGVGDKVTVYYDPNDPNKANVNTFLSVSFGPMMLAIAGIINVMIGLVLYTMSRK